MTIYSANLLFWFCVSLCDTRFVLTVPIYFILSRTCCYYRWGANEMGSSFLKKCQGIINKWLSNVFFRKNVSLTFKFENTSFHLSPFIWNRLQCITHFKLVHHQWWWEAVRPVSCLYHIFSLYKYHKNVLWTWCWEKRGKTEKISSEHLKTVFLLVLFFSSALSFDVRYGSILTRRQVKLISYFF